MQNSENIKQQRGFRTLSKEKKSEIASKGGIAAHKKGTAYEWDKEKAKLAGRLGGLAAAKAKAERKRLMGMEK